MKKILQQLLFAVCLLLVRAVCPAEAGTAGNRSIENRRPVTMQNVKDFGAKGDGVTKDTAAIQRAIDAGGVVCFPAGTYISGTIYLKSNGGLHLEPGAILKASPDRADYNAEDFCPQNFAIPKEYSSGAHFIVAVEQRNIVISGTGIIDGNREAFYGEKGVEPSCEDIPGKLKFSRDELKNGWRPGQMLFFCESRDITLRDVKLCNSPQWTCFLYGCQDVFVRGLRILNDQRTRNGDGIDIDCCQRVVVSDCIIDSGDDCITLRGSDNHLKVKRPCEQIAVTNCILHTNCNAIRVGVGRGLIRDAVFSNIVVHDSRTAINVVSNYGIDPDSGAGIENISFENFRVNCLRVCGIYSFIKGSCELVPKREIKNIRFRNFSGTFAKAVQVCGSSGRGIDGISFADFRLECTGNAFPLTEDYQASFGEKVHCSPAAAFYVSDAANVEFFRIKVLWNGQDQWKHGLAAFRSANITTESCDFGKENCFLK